MSYLPPRGRRCGVIKIIDPSLILLEKFKSTFYAGKCIIAIDLF